MPKMRPPLAQRQVREEAIKFRNDILGGMQDTGITKQRLAESIGVSKNTLLRKLKKPETLTLGDLIRINEELNRSESQ